MGGARVDARQWPPDVIVRPAQGPTKRVAWLLGTAAAWLDVCSTIIDQTEQADHDDSIVATHAHRDEIFAAA